MRYSRGNYRKTSKGKTAFAAAGFCFLAYLAIFPDAGNISNPPSATLPSISTASSIYVIDGDTVRINQESVRLVGFNTPETRGAACEAERALGYRAKERLRQLIDQASTIRLDYETTRAGSLSRDQYRRLLAVLLLDGRDVGAVLIGEGLARAYSGRTARGSWCE